MTLEETNKIRERKRRILFILLGILFGILIFNLFYLLDYFFYLDPELEKWYILFFLIGLGGFISGLIPIKVVDGLISGSIYSVLFYIQTNLMQVFYFIKFGILEEFWEPQILARSLLYVLLAIGGTLIGISLRMLVVLLINKLRENKIN